MPLFEYQCGRCGERETHLIRNSADEPGTCAACGTARPTRLMSTPAVVVRSTVRDFTGAEMKVSRIETQGKVLDSHFENKVKWQYDYVHTDGTWGHEDEPGAEPFVVEETEATRPTGDFHNADGSVNHEAVDAFEKGKKVG